MEKSWAKAEQAAKRHAEKVMSNLEYEERTIFASVKVDFCKEEKRDEGMEIKGKLGSFI